MTKRSSTNQLHRTTFSTSRLLEFFSEAELTMQIGESRDRWPVAILKELTDNGLDACEQAGVAPEIRVVVEPDSLEVRDNGPGLPLSTLERSLDYSVRVSEKCNYVSPTRGQLGNGFKCLWAAPFVANGERGLIEVVTGGARHRIDVSLDRLRQEPRIERTSTPDSIVRNGTFFKMHWPLIASYLEGAETDDSYNARQLLLAYAAFNPHTTFTLQDCHGTLNLPATGTTWRKWLPSNPTCPWWYTAKRLHGLITAYVAGESNGGPNLSVRDFIVDFAGLAGSGKSKAVLEKCGLSGKRLNELVRDGDVDIEAVARLLKWMQEMTQPVKPKALGVLGAEHLAASLVNHHDVDRRSVRYKRVAALTDTELPFVLEVAFGVQREDNEQGRKVLVGLNWSPALRVPIEHLHGLLGTMRVDDFDPAVVLVHLACPRLDYTDRGKRMLVLPTEIEEALDRSVRCVAKAWKQEKRHADREDRLSAQQMERVRKANQPHHLTIKEAAYQVMEEAYLQASADDNHPDRRLPANARQVMYAARPGVLKLTGGQCWSKSSYFTQHLLPDFIEEHPELTADWDVVFDARGHLSEPHTGRRIDLGTLQVRKYLKACTNGVLEQSPEVLIDHACPTVGPHNRFRFALFVEKEGFDQLLVSAGIAARFDVAIMSTKGMSVTAARQLVERFSERGVTILVLHDFDKSGFSILHTLQSDTRRYQFKVKPNVMDIGLRLEDVREMGLQSEEVHYPMSRSDPRIRLRACGATQEECEFLMHRQTLASPWEGERVELNAMTAAQFIGFLERKLIGAGATKLVPDQASLDAAYRQAYRIALAQQAVDSALAAIGTNDVPVPPANLRRHISKLIRGETLAWDEAIWQTVRKLAK